MFRYDNRIVIGVFIFATTIVLGYYLSQVFSPIFSPKKAQQNLTLFADDVYDTSVVMQDNKRTSFYITQKNSSIGLFETKIASVSDAYTFLGKKPLYESRLNSYTPQASDAQVLVPQTPYELALGSERTDDTGRTHYYFVQSGCGGVPVFSSYVSVHTTQDGAMYALDGNMLKVGIVCDRAYSASQTEEIAKKQAQSELEFQTIRSSKVVAEYIFSPLLAGFSEESKNYLVYIVAICSDKAFCRSYFVSQSTGQIVFSHDAVWGAMDREVAYGGTRRTEGQTPVSSTLTNKGYDILGETYNYFKNSHKRDSFDGRGAKIRLTISCSVTDNAKWDGAQIYTCDGFVTNDVIAHEFTHGVTQYAVGGSEGLIYQNESGGLNESLSDIFGSNVDSGDWTMAEDSSDGAIRDLSNPPRFGQPDSLYSPLYLCSGSQRKIVHTNSGVFNKAYYLMADGGGHNNCTIAGVGRQKASAVVYRALTEYLRGKSTANSRDMYNAITQACTDLYSSESSDCQNITRALQSTYMDKQPLGSELGVACQVGSRPTGAQPPAATCSGTGTTPPAATLTSQVTGVQTTGAPTPSGIYTSPTPLPLPRDKNTSGIILPLSSGGGGYGFYDMKFDGEIFTLNSTIMAENLIINLKTNKYSYKGRLIGPGDTRDIGVFQPKSKEEIELNFSGSTDFTEYYNFLILRIDKQTDESLPAYMGRIVSGNIEEEPKDIAIGLKVRLQGINRDAKPFEAFLARVGLINDGLDKPVFTEVFFVHTEPGPWFGIAEFDKSILEKAESPSSFAILIKGMRYSQKKICDAKPAESEIGRYQCDKPAILIKSGWNEFDLTGITLLAGDLWPQDGVVNALDISRIRNSLGSKDPDILLMMDLNYDGIINAVDDSLIISSLKVRTDQK